MHLQAEVERAPVRWQPTYNDRHSSNCTVSQAPDSMAFVQLQPLVLPIPAVALESAFPMSLRFLVHLPQWKLSSMKLSLSMRSMSL